MESDFKEYPKTLPAKDYWGQVKRTVNGQPVSEEQIEMIVRAICANLALEHDGKDVLLDLGCGNGALSQLLFDRVSAFFGVDYSEFLISVAQRDFQKSPAFRFAVGDVMAYLQSEQEPERFTKVLCYGCFSYFPAAEAVLTTLNQRFPQVSHVFIGNLPDKERAHLFYRNGLPGAEEMADHGSKIGIWRTQEEFKALATRSGWEAHIHIMPKEFYASHYRYDVTLLRNS